MTQHHLDIWAAFLANLDWPANYRRGCLVVHGQRPLLVVPTRSMTHNQFCHGTSDAELAAIRLNWSADVLIVGTHPLPAVRSYLRSDPPAGLLGEFDSETDEYDWDAGLWLRCDTCGRLGVYHEMRGWHLRPCGHHAEPQERHCRGRHVPEIGRAWAEACFTTTTRGVTR